jgi:hypothetical protein
VTDTLLVISAEQSLQGKEQGGCEGSDRKMEDLMRTSVKKRPKYNNDEAALMKEVVEWKNLSESRLSNRTNKFSRVEITA